jgi:N6-L-threonylcarbamoyladenine synthase
METTKHNKIILAIETSCDETAAAVLEVEITSPSLSLERRGMGPQIKTLSSVVKSQISLHKSFGGVVPEVAARAHVKNILPVVQKALSTAHYPLSTIDYIAVTQGPGLIPSLIVGVEFAKALALATNKPMIPVNHMLGHLYSPFSKQSADSNQQLEKLFPMIGLIVSGGHTILAVMNNIHDYKVLGQTVDDAAGEAFDKVAKLLKLPYPGGPEVSKLAEKSKTKLEFPRPMINSKDYNFSFSGLKTAVLYYVQSLPPTSYNLQAKQDICKAFQDAAVDVLVTKTMRAVKEYGAKSISLSGGVAANKALRESLNLQSKILNLQFFVPPINLCTDNAEMIGLAAAFMLHSGFKPVNYKKLKADSNLNL